MESKLLDDIFIGLKIKEASCGDRFEFMDSAERGVRIRVTARGARWSLMTRDAQGSRVRISLGAWPDVPSRDARAKARGLKAKISPSGGEYSPNSLGYLLQRYLKLKLSQLRTGEEAYRAIKSALADKLHHEPNTVSRREVSQAVLTIAEHAPAQANRSLAYIKAFYSWLVAHGYLQTNPVAAIAKPYREIARERTPSLGELGLIWRAAEEMAYPFGQVVQLLMLTASRCNEVAMMRREELELPPQQATGHWTIPASRSKNGRAIRVPLAPQARQVIECALGNSLFPGYPWVFTTNGDRPVSGWSKAKLRLDRVIAEQNGGRVLAPWRLHDLRRSFATHACDVLDVPPAVADRCLNHIGAASASTVARVYGRSELLEPRRRALEGWADLVANATRV